MRLIKFCDAGSPKMLLFLANNFHLPATDIGQMCKHRWKIKLFLNALNNIIR